MMINKSIKELEKDRIDKIKSLNLEETKAYVSKLHKKMHMTNDKETIDLCSEKIVEIFDLMDQKYLLDVASAYWHFQLMECFNDIDFNSLKIDYLFASNSFEMFYNGYFILLYDFETLKSLFQIYYHRYVRQSNEIDHILNMLSEGYDFRNEDFASYLKHEYHLKEDFHLAKYVRIAIARLVISLKEFIKTMEDKHERVFSDEFIKNKLDEIENMRKTNNEKDFLDLLDHYKDLLHSIEYAKSEYVKVKNDVLDFLSKDDGFVNEKLAYYETYNYSFSLLDKEAILNDKPRFDFETLEFDFY